MDANARQEREEAVSKKKKSNKSGGVKKKNEGDIERKKLRRGKASRRAWPQETQKTRGG